jgi:hypothetical protein
MTMVERRRQAIGGSVPRCTTSRSFSSGASPVIRIDMQIWENPLREPAVLVPMAPSTLRSPSSVDSTMIRFTFRAAAEKTSEVGHARGERVQQVLGRVRTSVGAQQDRRLTRVEGECPGARGVLAAGGVEVLDRRATGCAASQVLGP